MSIYFQQNESIITIAGNTYPHRQAIKSPGARFNGVNKCWEITYSRENLAAVEELCQSTGMLPNSTPKTTHQEVRPALSDKNSPKPLGNLLADLSQKGRADAEGESPPSGSNDDGKPSGYTIAELMDIVNTTLQQRFPRPIWVVGEIQNLHKSKSGLYLGLAEEVQGAYSSQHSISVSTTIWSNTLGKIQQKHGHDVVKGILQEGLKVRFLCHVTLYKGRGSISLSVADIDPNYTKGELALAREKLLRELRSKGLDKANKERSLSPFPFTVGLITAEGSRAKSDFLHQLEDGGFPGKVIFAPSMVQGDHAPRQLSRSLAALIAKDVDLIVITRGGGSASDLRWFDGKELAYEIAQCPIPVVAAIGHHDDFCVAEEICFERRKTPTAAADFILEHFQATRQSLQRAAMLLKNQQSRTISNANQMIFRLSDQIKSAASQKIAAQSHRIHESILSLRLESERQIEKTRRFLASSQERLNIKTLERLQGIFLIFANLCDRLSQSCESKMSRERDKIRLLQQVVHSKDPRPWLQKGWTQLRLGPNRIVSVDDVDIGETIQAQLADGSLSLTIAEKSKQK